MTIDVAIIGGGVSGLATAWELRKRGYRAVVLERQVRTGGNAFSENIDGFIMEHGPSTINAYDAHAQAVSSSLGLGADQTYLGDGVKRRYLVGGGKLKSIPIHPMGFITADYMSFRGRLRMMMEPLMRRGKSACDESIQDYAARRFGQEFAERIMDPLVGGLYGGRADELSMSSLLPKMLMLEHKYGSVTAGMIARSVQGGHMPGKRLYSWRAGIGTLPRALAAKCEDVRTGITVRNIRRNASGYGIDCGGDGVVQARAVVLATQPHVASALLDELDVDSAEATASISSPPMAVAFFGFRRDQVDHPLDGLGFLAAEVENIGLTGVQFNSTMFSRRAPDGCVSMTAYVGGARQPDLARQPEADLTQLVQERLSGLLGIRGVPLVSRVRHWNLGLPQYRVGHSALVEKLETACERSPGLFLTGNYLAGPSVAACLNKACDTARLADDFMAQSATSQQLRGVNSAFNVEEEPTCPRFAF